MMAEAKTLAHFPTHENDYVGILDRTSFLPNLDRQQKKGSSAAMY
jgi:hypothetical protein